MENMKSLRVLFFGAVIALLAVSAFSKSLPPPTIQKQFTPTNSNRTLGYQIILEGGDEPILSKANAKTGDSQAPVASAGNSGMTAIKIGKAKKSAETALDKSEDNSANASSSAPEKSDENNEPEKSSLDANANNAGESGEQIAADQNSLSAEGENSKSSKTSSKKAKKNKTPDNNDIPTGPDCPVNIDDTLTVFVFDAQNYGIPLSKIKKVYVSGTFNSWCKISEQWRLDNYRGGIYTLVCNTSAVNIPGPSGHPEFKFFVIHDTDYIQVICGKRFPKVREDRITYDTCSGLRGFTFLKSNLLLFDNTSLSANIKNEKLALKAKNPPKDFKKRGPEGFAEYANFRALPGLPKVFRGYHPYKRTAKLLSDDDVMRATTAQEKARIKTTNSLLELNSVKTIVTLTGNEQIKQKKEQISSYIENLNHAGNHLFVDLSDSEIYRIMGGEFFAKTLGEIIKFLIAHPQPAFIHCHQGVDETGIICAAIEALVGQTWETIKADFLKSNDAGLGMYRNERLLEYAFERMLGKSPLEIDDLSKAVTEHYIKTGFITSEDIQNLKALGEASKESAEKATAEKAAE